MAANPRAGQPAQPFDDRRPQVGGAVDRGVLGVAALDGGDAGGLHVVGGVEIGFGAGSFLARLIPEGRSGEVFGLYATTGRVISFLAPFMYTLFIGIGAWTTGMEATQYWGILGIVLVILAGFLVMLPVKEHHRHNAME